MKYSPTSFHLPSETKQLLNTLAEHLGLTRTAITELGYLLLAECFLPPEAPGHQASRAALDMGRQMVLERALTLLRTPAPSASALDHGRQHTNPLD